ncbi:hypothetical protein [Mangrovibacillus cuniculi]|uniref:Uncharacterized protein n=1 Tax=Mangrovibacillus cuniculi TaxID=2593652 RepID=A0A7S8CCR3_9BACI|nr:hypothetical protein [Mangrovibacillus cuniculi]QPC47597.1 hypothetical protein G8O30_11855 [Mangrovibacillus cuniculi]
MGKEHWSFLPTSTYSLNLFLGYAMVVGAVFFFFIEKLKRLIMAHTVAYSIILMANIVNYLLIFITLIFDFFITLYGYYEKQKIIIILALMIGFYFVKPGKDGFDFLKVSALATIPFLLFMFMYRYYFPIEEGLEILALLFMGGIIFLAIPFVTAVWLTFKSTKG